VGWDGLRWDEWVSFYCCFMFIFIYRTGSKNKQQNSKKQEKLNYKTLTKYYKLIQNLQKLFTVDFLAKIDE